ncbi:hypothetical protein DWZ61_08190 [Clostridium sp. AF34-10BH]|jgi:hypothetical protein|uniref:hypothetical protein n=1 Tax=Clostridium sp. AF34-10BH TaxID=2293011 RepID=UPI000E4D773B|nr:hypothetical protein [Clostridium sp. AF34-10BH]RHP31363.1 hypothetical protein DWZ61_08190 [Clostridium sp. AF34-10BH]
MSTAENINLKQQMAIQSANVYKGKICCYASVTKKGFREGDPALAMSETSNVCINIFDAASAKGVKFYFGGTLPSFIFEKTKLCMALGLTTQKQEGTEEKKSAAYTVKIKFGPFKDRTPAEVLLESPNNYNPLCDTYNKLMAANDPKFARQNSVVANAIAEAGNLFMNGQLDKTSVNTYQKIIIWDGMRTPNVNKVNQKGLTEARTAKITFDMDPGNKEPYCIEIMNCMAPPVQGAQIGARLSQCEDKITLMMNFSEEAWYGFWKDTIEAKTSFGRLMENERIDYSDKNMWKPQQNQQYAQPNNVVQMQQGYSQYAAPYMGQGYR